MSLKTSWPVRCALALLTVQWVGGCGGGGTGPTDPPPPVADTTAPATRAAPAGGTFASTVAVTLVCEDGTGSGCDATYYTLDGSAPTSASTRYREPFTLAATTTVRFFSVDKKGNAEGARSEPYVIDTVAPTVSASPAGGTYATAQQVRLTCDDGAGSGCAAIHYTMDGTAPTRGSATYAEALRLAADTTVRFIAVDGAGNTSQAGTETYRIVPDVTAPVTTASPGGGLYNTAPLVVLTCEDNADGSGCGATFYTLDGTAPAASSTRYTGPITVSVSTQVRFFSVDAAGNAEAARSEQYTVDSTPPATVATPVGGAYQNPFNVTLRCTDTGQGCAVTRYTTDGSVPGDASPRYSTPISITRTTTLRFFSVDTVGNVEPVREEVYTLPVSTSSASAQIAAVRGAVDGTGNLPIDGALITYVKPGVGNLTNDPPGFFLQAERTGPALFVVAEPDSLFPRPEAGMRVSVTANNKRLANGMVRADLGGYGVLSTGHPLAPLVQDVSGVDLPSVWQEFEGELITVAGTIHDSFGPAGLDHVQAPLVTAGVPAGAPSASILKLRVVDSVRDQLDLSRGCSVSITSPLWFFTPNIQVSVWTPEQVLSQSCPGPSVVSAQAYSAQTVLMRFERNIDPATVLSDGSQFSIPGLTVTRATPLSPPTYVWLETSVQTPRAQYTVTVAPSVRDMTGTGMEPTGDTLGFRGWVAPAHLRITELAPAVAQGRDLVELYVVQGGNTGGMTLVDFASVTTPLATLPDVDVATGDVILLHLTPDGSTPGTDAPGSELTSKTQYPQGQYTSNYDTAWDFHGTGFDLRSGNRTFRIRTSLGSTQDALAAAVSGNTSANYLSRLQELQFEGQWRPYDCNGVPCTYTSFPTAWDISFNWSSAFPNGGKSTTVRRVALEDSDRATDWAVGPSSLGLPNP